MSCDDKSLVDFSKKKKIKKKNGSAGKVKSGKI
jgi:hypothetical protein